MYIFIYIYVCVYSISSCLQRNIGDGGFMSDFNSQPTNGGNSIFGPLTAFGGGAGGGYSSGFFACKTGGSGGALLCVAPSHFVLKDHWFLV